MNETNRWQGGNEWTSTGSAFRFAAGSLGFDHAPRIYVCDDERGMLAVFRRALAPFGYDLHTFGTGKEVLAALREPPLPDLVVSDVRMPGMTGFELCEALRANPAWRSIPVLLVTGLDQLKDKVRGLESGADDFLPKPFHPVELRARVTSLLRIKALHDELEKKNALLQDRNKQLEYLVAERTRELARLNVHLRERNEELGQANEMLTRLKEDLASLNIGLVAALEKANELNDDDTGNHIRRVCEYSEVLARAVGQSDEFCTKIRLYASLHDIGKVGIPDSILKKPGKFTEEEFEIMKRHTRLGYELLVAARAEHMARNIALCHHERWDGTGYPQGLRGEEIPLEARIVALADVWDALTQRRCYKEALPEDKALEIVQQQRGKHFDPALVDALMAHLEEFRAIQQRYADSSPSAEERFAKATGTWAARVPLTSRKSLRRTPSVL